MSAVLLTNIHTVLPMTGTLHAPEPQARDVAILVVDGEIAWIGGAAGAASDPLVREQTPDVIDLRDHVVLPGLVNTHHHYVQSLTRVVAQDKGLFDWLVALYPIWLQLDPDAVHAATQTALAELMLSGCTTSSDHLYIYPNGSRLDDQIHAAAEMGIRFHATRGSMTVGQSKGGLPPDAACETDDAVLRDSQRLIQTYHDGGKRSMLRVALAPCSPFNVSTDLMRESARMARAYGVMLHTHLAETHDEDEYCRQHYGMRPLEFAENVEWLGHDVWFAHGIHFNETEVRAMAACGCGVAHCPTSNMRLASGIAPVRLWLDAGLKVGLGVDGTASNDGGHLLAEARMAMMLQRVAAPADPSRMSAYEALWVATRGGAAVFGRDDIGRLAPGCAADLIAIDLNRVEYAGALHDPLAAVVFCAPRGVDFSMINGRIVVRDGRLVTADLGNIVTRHNAISRRMFERAGYL